MDGARSLPCVTNDTLANGRREQAHYCSIARRVRLLITTTKKRNLNRIVSNPSTRLHDAGIGISDLRPSHAAATILQSGIAIPRSASAELRGVTAARFGAQRGHQMASAPTGLS